MFPLEITIKKSQVLLPHFEGQLLYILYTEGHGQSHAGCKAILSGRGSFLHVQRN